MKKSISLILALILLTGLFTGCSTQSLLLEETETKELLTAEKETISHVDKTEEKTEEINHGDDFEPEEPATEELPTEPVAPSPNGHMLDGKKVIFIGNSYTYYGNAVITNARSNLKQSKRGNNKGYFYQICKNNGANVNVTNWTYGGHSLSDIFVKCAANRGCDGTEHQTYLTDRYYDYVFIQEGGQQYDISLDQIEMVLNFFREANPNTKFFFLVQRAYYDSADVADSLPLLKKLPDYGVTVVEWGALVDDIIKGKTQVPGGLLTYNQNSFIVDQSASDGFHPNMLTGYITAQMAYSAATGESAVGQDYSFATNPAVNTAFSPLTFIDKYYKRGKTNMLDIFQSPADMRGLQTLMDQYLAEHRYKTY